MEKECTKCGTLKPLAQFHLRGEGRRHSQCNACKAFATKLHYQRNKEAYVRRAKARKSALKDDFRKLVDDLKSHPCGDCGHSFPPFVMDFDHREGELKIDNVANLVASPHSMKKLLEEIAKCDLVCANCHRIRTHARRHKPAPSA